MLKITGIEETRRGIVQNLIPEASEITSELQDNLYTAIRSIQKGEVTQGMEADFLSTMSGIDQNVFTPEVIENIKGSSVKELESGFGKLGPSIENAGNALMRFGSLLQGTPFEAFGNILITIGTSLSAFGGLLGDVRKNLVDTYKATLQDIVVKTADAIATETLGDVQVTTAMKAKALGVAMWESLGPYALIIVVILALIGAYKALDAAIVTDKEKLENASNAAAAASEAYDSLKQETSELNDAIEQIQTNENAFDGLVAGTAEFNEQLLNTNEQIMKLLDKFPELNDYLTIDNNGVMHISEAGLLKAKEIQKDRQNKASALNMIQTADLRAEENRQKAKNLRKKSIRMSDEEYQHNIKEANLLDERAKVETDIARKSAVRVALSGKEVKNVDKLTNLFAEQYESRLATAKIEVDKMNKHQQRQIYADYYGYTYNKSTEKILDSEGKEVSYDDGTIRDAVIEETVLLNFQEESGSLEAILGGIDKKFNSEFKESFGKGSKELISDILSSNFNADSDSLRKLIQDSDNKLEDFVNSLTEKELSVILGISVDQIDETNLEQFRKNAVDKIKSKATDIMDAQSETYENLGAMFAQSKFPNVKIASTDSAKKYIEDILSNFTTEEINLFSRVGSELKEYSGTDSMQRYLNFMDDIYKKGDRNAITEINDIAKNSDFKTATGRLEAYTKMTRGASEETRRLGQTMLESVDSANLLGDAFDEFMSGDYEKLAENMDQFQNSMGEIDATGIMKASKESHTLSVLLDSGQVSANGLALALQGIEDGKYSIGEVNSSVLRLLSTIDQLGDAASRAHETVSNFDAGIDTGEGEDFVKENAEKAKEYFDNGEYGNEQLQNYLKLAVGADKFYEILKSHHGDLYEAEKEMMAYVTTFKDGFGPVWDKLTKGQDLKGETIKFETDDKELKEKFEQAKVLWDENGFLKFEIGDMTTEELRQYLKEALDISEEYADLLLQDLKNYDAQLGKLLTTNDKKALFKDKQFLATHQGFTDTRHTNVKDRVLITQTDLETYAEATGIEYEEALDEWRKYAEQAGKALEVLETRDEEGNELSGEELVGKYADKYYGKTESTLLEQYSSKVNGETQIDVDKMVADAMARGINEQTAKEMAFQAMQQYKGEGTFMYEGQQINPADYANSQAFVEATETLTTTSKWVPIGEAIAQGFLSYISKKEEPDKTSPQDPNTDNAFGTHKEGGRQDEGGDITKILDPSFWGKVNQNLFGEGSLGSKWLFGGATKFSNLADYFSQEGSQGAIDIENISGGFTIASESLATSGTTLQSAGDGLSKAAAELSTAAATLSAINNPQSNIFNTPHQYAPGAPSNIPFNQSVNQNSTFTVETTDGTNKLNELKQVAIDTKNIINQGAVFKAVVKDDGLSKAAKQASKITKAAGDQKINVTTTTSGNSKEIDQLASSVKNFKSLGGNKNIKLTTTLSGASTLDIKSQISAIEKFYEKRDDTVTLTTKYKTEGHKEDLATGTHNHGYVSAPPSVGSAARGSYGQLGPKGRGGLTLTGELGYEIAWLPDENRSMILGANGPQMVDLPGNAVVWTHEQSKKIMKQKSIPAGSHANRQTGRKKDDNNNNNNNNNKNNNKNSNNKTKDNKGSSNTVAQTAKKVSSVAGKIEVWWENMARAVDANQKKVDKSLSDFEKALKTFGTTETSIKKIIDGYRKNLQQSIDLNKKEEDKAKKELGYIANGGNKFYSQKEITYEVTKKKKKKTVKESKTQKVDLNNFIKYNKQTGAYEIDQAKINKVASKNRSQAQAIKDAAEKEINDRLSKLKTAQDNIKKAQEALEKLSNDVYQTFYQWEKSINDIYLLSQKLQVINSQLTTTGTQLELQYTKLEVGATTASQSAEKINALLGQQQQLMLLKVQGTQENLSAKQDAFSKSLSLQSYLSNYLKNPDSSDAKNDYLAAKKTFEFLDKINMNDNNFNYTDALKALNNQGMTKDEYEAIKSILDGIFEKQNDALDAQNESYSVINESLQQMEELQSFVAEFEEELLSGIEEQAEEEIKKLEQLNSSITKAYKELLDEVKNKLDQRRKSEDNIKTESDISKKQQRLAMLRADTSGNHAVEIAQLEQELADARRDYQRNLEDQLIERLQHQNDIAEKQRQQQIDLLQAHADIAKNTDTNLAQVKEWLLNPDQYYEEIRSAWLSNKGYNDATPEQQKQLLQQWEVEWAKYQGYSKQLDNSKEIIDEMTKAEASIDKLTETLANISNPKYTAKYLKGLGYGAKSLKLGGFSGKQIHDAGYSASEFKTAGYTKEQALKAGYTTQEVSKVYGSTKKATTTANTTANTTAKTPTAYLSKLPAKALSKASDIKTLQKGLNQLLADRKLSGFNRLTVDGDYGKKTKAAVKILQKALGVVQDGKWGPKTRTAALKKFPKYVSGGLANFTGPAWLDGTPTKPELVLSAADTKNFIALKDILSKAISSSDTLGSSYGDATYEININVDHINSDYDVDRVAERVKKIIVKDSGYRNVTQVRRLR